MASAGKFIPLTMRSGRFQVNGHFALFAGDPRAVRQPPIPLIEQQEQAAETVEGFGIEGFLGCALLPFPDKRRRGTRAPGAPSLSGGELWPMAHG